MANHSALIPSPSARASRKGPAFDSRQLQLDFDQAAASGDSARLTEALSQFAHRFAAALEADATAKFNNPAIDYLAREIFGSAAGHARDAYDAAEAGFNIYLARMGFCSNDMEAVIRWLQDQVARLPCQNKRDYTQVEFQQFSTPHDEAFVVVKAAALWPGMNVLEPSAGTGNIAVISRLMGASVDTNEIDPRRNHLLLLQGFSPTAFDAERLDNLLPPERFYDAIVMNPPFSATGGRVRGHDGAFGARHVEQALLRLKPGGRLVAIVGGELALDRAKPLRWWSAILDKYRVRANIAIDGIVYSRFGTTYDHQIIVIDHEGPTPGVRSIITASRLPLLSAAELLEDLSKEDVYGRVCMRSSHGGERETTRNLPPGSNARDRPDRGTGRMSAGGRERRRFPAGGVFVDDGRLAGLERTGTESARTVVGGDQSCTATGANDSSAPASSPPQLGGLADTEHARSNPDGVGELLADPSVQAAHIEQGAVFASYRVQKALVRGSEPHPANVVESAAMACVEPPDVTYRHHLPQEVIGEGRISDIQIEDVIYAGQTTGVLLPNGSRKGQWNGDGTGIGKGREIYAFIYDQLQQGRIRHVHISASHLLCADAERDKSAVGVPLTIFHQADYHYSEAIISAPGVVFTTYTMLSTDFGGNQERFNQLIAWMGKDFDGVIAFDEAHLMKNAAATPHGGKATVDHGTLRGNMGIALQRMFPNARVRYFSATGATEARHMAPYERLGLWGAGAPFADFSAFLVAMQRGGVAAMEMLCRDLKSVGTYLSRTISYGPTVLPDCTTVPESAVEYEPLLHRLTATERKQYDRIAELWSELLVAFEEGEKNAGQARNAHRYSQFYSAQQRFFLQLMMAYALPDVLPAIDADLKAGKSVVVSLFNTGEAQADRKVNSARAQGVELSQLDATPREMIVQLIEKQFPLYQYHEETDPVTGNINRVRVEDAAGNPEINRHNERRQRQLLDQVADLDFPANPLDAMIARFGADNVAEISGRTHRFEKGRYVRRKIEGVSRRILNEYETQLFQDGKKRLAVISGAGTTGISVHADLDAKNQQRRVFYAFQLSWSADQQMQAFGRVHRSHQRSAPIIRLVLLDLAGQKRLVNAVSKRLAALGALTKGERQSLSSDLFQPEDVTDEYGKAALARLYSEVLRGQHKELGLRVPTLDRMGVLDKKQTTVKEACLNNVEMFLNRIMVLPVENQNAIFELFYQRYLEVVEVAKRQGAFDFGVEEIRARRLRQTADPEILFVDPGSGARTLLHQLAGEIDVWRHSFESVASSATLGFYRNKRSGRIYGVIPHHLGLDLTVYFATVKGPRRAIERRELTAKYELVEHEQARAWWNDECDRTPPTEERQFHLLSGAIFPIYDKIMGAAGIQSVRVARAVLENGQALVGLNLSRADVPGVKQRLGIGAPLGQASPDDVLQLVASGAIIELDNGWRLFADTISGDDVIELMLNGVLADHEELLGYGLSEEIIHYKRRWFTTLEDAVDVYAPLLARHRPVRDLSMSPAPEMTETDDDL
jgi:predicted RNA methylase